MAYSYDDGAERPLNNKTEYNSPYAAYYNQSTGYLPPQQPKKPLSKWIKFGIPVAIVVIAAAVVGGVVGSRASSNSNKSSSNSGGTSSSNPSVAASAAISAKTAVGRFATATDSFYQVPLYPSTVRLVIFVVPFQSSLSWFMNFIDQYRCVHYSYLYTHQRRQVGLATGQLPALQPQSHHCST